MKVLIVHNFYQRSGGEDRVAEAQVKLLSEMGHDVRALFVSNDSINSVRRRVAAGISLFYSFRGRSIVKRELERQRPDLVHVHNTFPLLSLSIFDELRSVGVPSVMTLHNYRSLCPTGTLYHDGQINDRSVRKNSLWTVRVGAYRGSLLETGALALAIEVHRRLGTWWRKPDLLTVLTNHARQTFIRGGFPANKMRVLPNFCYGPAVSETAGDRRGALYVGRLSEEKGIRLLIEAWRKVDYPLTIIGDGPISQEIQRLAPENVTFLGARSAEVVSGEMLKSMFIVVPSMWYEMFPMTVLEAYSCGLPVLASRIGGLAEIVEEGGTGLLFERGDLSSLIGAIRVLVESPKLCEVLGAKARDRWLASYSPQVGYEELMRVYDSVLSPRALT